jgi:hypothetical protein
MDFLLIDGAAAVLRAGGMEPNATTDARQHLPWLAKLNEGCQHRPYCRPHAHNFEVATDDALRE